MRTESPAVAKGSTRPNDNGNYVARAGNAAAAIVVSFSAPKTSVCDARDRRLRDLVMAWTYRRRCRDVFDAAGSWLGVERHSRP